MSNEFVPEWAKGIVWYQIFPERFWNGDRSNDPKLADQRNAWPLNQDAPFEIHEWTAEWYKRQPYELENGLDMWQTLHRRRYGGDLQGILDRLDYLEDLGIGAIYLNPVFEAPSEHKYDGSSYHHIDPNFGPDPDGDRALMATEQPHDPTTWVWTSADKLALELIAELHKRGMRVIFDGVFNHMGLNSWVYRDVEKNQQASPVADWLKVESWRNEAAGTEFKATGWFGYETLPELNQDENGLTAGPKGYVFAATERWLAPNGDVDAGIDGWRLDVAFCIEHPFWKDWRKHVKAIKPDAYLTAEIIRPIPTTQPYLLGDEFDAVMNYNFAWSGAEWIIQHNNRISTAELDRQLHELIAEYPAGVAYVQQNLFGSHDSARIGTHIVNRSALDFRDWMPYHAASKVQHNLLLDLRKPTDEERKLQKLFVLLQMTYVGAPMIYYGDEAGMWSANDPDDRQPMVWPELDYEAQTTAPDQTSFDQPQSVSFDHDLHAFYKHLIQIHNALPALKVGSFETLLIEDDVYGFVRRTAEQEVVVLLNRSEGEARTVAMNGEFEDVLNGGVVNSSIALSPLWGSILVSKSAE